MNKVVNGKRYNTETATLLANTNAFRKSDGQIGVGSLRYYEESLYRKKTGEFFLAGFGNALSHYAKPDADGLTRGGEQIIPLTSKEAYGWLNNYIGFPDASEYNMKFSKYRIGYKSHRAYCINYWGWHEYKDVAVAFPIGRVNSDECYLLYHGYVFNKKFVNKTLKEHYEEWRTKELESTNEEDVIDFETWAIQNWMLIGAILDSNIYSSCFIESYYYPSEEQWAERLSNFRIGKSTNRVYDVNWGFYGYEEIGETGVGLIYRNHVFKTDDVKDIIYPYDSTAFENVSEEVEGLHDYMYESYQNYIFENDVILHTLDDWIERKQYIEECYQPKKLGLTGE